MKDPHPDKGRALARLEEKQGRTIDKTGGRAARERAQAAEDEAADSEGDENTDEDTSNGRTVT